MCYGGYTNLSRGITPPLMTHAIYLDRAMKLEAIRARGDPKWKPKPLSAKQMKEAIHQQNIRSVNGRSILTELNYFDIVDNTLIDMMHTGQGTLSGHFIPLIKLKKRFTKYGITNNPWELKNDTTEWQKLDDNYRKLQAPNGIAPASKQPF